MTDVAITPFRADDRPRPRDLWRRYLEWTTKQDNATAHLLYDRLAKFNGFIRDDYAPG